MHNLLFKQGFRGFDLFYFSFQEHIFNLMKSDSYSRYLRSDMYKELIGGTKKKVPLFPFHFPSKSKGEG